MTQRAKPSIWVKKIKIKYPGTWVKILNITQRAERSIWVKNFTQHFFECNDKYFKLQIRILD